MIPTKLAQTLHLRGWVRHRTLLAGAAFLTTALAANAQSTPTESAAPAAGSEEPAKATEAKPLPAPEAAEGDDMIVLSPFEVSAGNDKGYYAANSMSGTRFNSSLQDLAAPVSVMTKEQMRDFGMLDINDVFLYSSNTEGTGTYSDFAMNRNGEMTDNVSLNPNTANRVRGIASANVSYGNFETSRRSPLDPIVLDRVEISRGPNANVFGLGNPSGTVNQVPAAANPSKNRVFTEFRWDSYDGHRVAVDINRVLVQDKLAVRFSAVDQTDGFVRKPSGIDTRRYNGMIRFQPFKNTTFNAAFLYYEAQGARPNFTPPRDFVSYWIEMGRPSWHPVNQTVTVGGVVYDHAAMIAAGNSRGTQTDAFVNQVGQPWNAFHRNGGQFQRSNLYIDQDGVNYWTNIQGTTGSTPLANAGTNANNIRFFGSSPGPNGASGKFLNQPMFVSVPSIKDKSVYDYEKVNLASPNYVWDEVESYYYTLDHFFLNNSTQMLAAQIGFFREDAEQYRKVPIGDAGTGGQNGQLWVDVNETYLDGTPNPFFGRPYIGVGEPIYSYLPAKWDTTRAQAAYSYDFTQSDGWARNLGKHLISPYYEYKYRVQRKYSYREAVASDHAWLAQGQPGVPVNPNWARANQANITNGPQAGPNQIRTFHRYYVGDAEGTNVDYAPGRVNTGDFNFHWGMPTNWRAEPARLEELATTNNTGGANNSKRTIKTEGFVIQSHLLDGRVVPTFGLRRDRTYTKLGYTPQQLSDNNTTHNFPLINGWETGPYKEAEGKTETMGVTARPFRDFGPVNSWYNSSSGVARFFGELLRDSVFYYNQSDNFIPEQPAYDLFLNELPNQTGEGEDWGAWFNLFDNKLTVRINRYVNKQLNARDGDAGTMALRLLRYDIDPGTISDSYRLHKRATEWWSLTNPSWTADQVEARVLEQMQMTAEEYQTRSEYFVASMIAATNDITAKGTEVEIFYNPTSYWTISASGEKKESINSNISSSVDDYINQRLPIWQSIVDRNYDPTLINPTDDPNSRGWTAASQTVPVANPNHLWWIHRYGNATQSAAENFALNIQSPWGVIKAQEGKSRPSVRQYAFRASTNLRLSGITDNEILKKFSVGGAVRWEDKGAIGYYGVEEYPAVVTALDGNRPIWDPSHTYVDLNFAYQTKFFDDKAKATFRLNIKNVQESGRLQGTGAFPNGEIHSWRIVDPRQFVLSADFEF